MMQIESLRYAAYGKFVNRTLTFCPNLNVIFGHNEAGKSTVFNSIKTLLYGFKPANRDMHPYTHWNSNLLNFSAQICANGELFDVERRLMSVAGLKITHRSDRTVQSLRNQTLPFISGIGEGLYSTVFHVTAEQLNQLESTSWDDIRDQLIFNSGSDYLISAADVMQQLEQDIHSIWRPDKRGNPEIKQALGTLSQLQSDRHHSEKRYDAIRTAMRAIQSLEAEQSRLFERRRAVADQLKRYRRLVPIQEKAEALNEMNRQMYRREHFETMPRDLLTRRQDMESRIEAHVRRQEALLSNLRDAEAQLPELSERHRQVMALKDAAEFLRQLRAQWIEADGICQMKDEQIEDALKRDFSMLFGEESWGDKRYEQLEGLPLESIRTLAGESGGGTSRPFFYGIIFSVVLCAAGVLLKQWLLCGLAGLLLGASALGMLRDRRLRINRMRTRREALDRLSNGLSIPIESLSDPTGRFLNKLEMLQQRASTYFPVLKRAQEAHHRREKLEGAFQTWADGNGFEIEGDIPRWIEQLQNDLESAFQRDLRYKEALLTLNRCREDAEGALEVLEALRAEKADLDAQLEVFGNGDLTFAVDQFQKNVDRMRRIRVYEEELSREDEALHESPSVSRMDIEALESEEVQLHETERKVIENKATLEAQLNQLRQESKADVYDSDIVEQNTYIQALYEKRDVLMVLREIIGYVDAQFRRANQPNVIHRVSALMSEITGGRYSEVILEEGAGQFELSFIVDGAAVPLSRAFSKGTVNQLFFAFRMAVVEALDPEGTVPLVFDEAFVNWDRERLAKTMAVLKAASQGRQIIVMTCHEHMLEALGGVHRIQLDS